MHGEARHHAVFQCLTHAFFHRCHEYAGDDSPLTLSTEFEPGAAFERFDTQHDLAELARAPALLLVAAMPFRFLGDRFTIGYGGLVSELDLALLRQTRQLHVSAFHPGRGSLFRWWSGGVRS